MPVIQSQSWHQSSSVAATQLPWVFYEEENLQLSLDKYCKEQNTLLSSQPSRSLTASPGKMTTKYFSMPKSLILIILTTNQVSSEIMSFIIEKWHLLFGETDIINNYFRHVFICIVIKFALRFSWMLWIFQKVLSLNFST